jgi:hypothetical protein
MLDITFSYPYDNKIILSLHAPLLFSYLAQVHTGIIFGLQNRLATVGSFLVKLVQKFQLDVLWFPMSVKLALLMLNPELTNLLDLMIAMLLRRWHLH